MGYLSRGAELHHYNKVVMKMVTLAMKMRMKTLSVQLNLYWMHRATVASLNRSC